ncbi:glycosyltransferase family 2 protein [Myxococcaceae bacterium GXIMD 01537]
MDMRISVVIPAYGAREFIHRPVASVLGQTREDWEVVIASDDGVDYAQVLREGGIADPRIRCVLTEGVGTGPANARNLGMDAARGRLIATLDADDRLAPNALERLAPLALEHGAAYSRCILLEHETERPLESCDREMDSGPLGLEDILTSQIHTFAGIVFDRSRVDARGLAWMRRWEDVYFYVKCFDSIERMYHLAEPLYVYYRRAGSICNRPETGFEYMHWALELARRIEQGDTLGLRSGSALAIFHRFLRSRHDVEASFIQEVERGRYQDYHEFIRNNPERFHRLAA